MPGPGQTGDFPPSLDGGGTFSLVLVKAHDSIPEVLRGSVSWAKGGRAQL